MPEYYEKCYQLEYEENGNVLPPNHPQHIQQQINQNHQNVNEQHEYDQFSSNQKFDFSTNTTSNNNNNLNNNRFNGNNNNSLRMSSPMNQHNQSISQMKAMYTEKINKLQNGIKNFKTLYKKEMYNNAILV